MTERDSQFKYTLLLIITYTRYEIQNPTSRKKSGIFLVPAERKKRYKP